MSHNSEQATVESSQPIDDPSSYSHPVQVAVDLLRLPYYGDHTLRDIHAAVPRVDGKWELTIAIAVVVGEGRSKLLATHVVGDELSSADAAERLLGRVQMQAPIDTMYVGRELGTVKELERVEDADVRYVTRVLRTPRTRECVEEMQHDVKVISDYPMSSYRETQVQTSLVLVRFASADKPEVTPYVTDYEVCDGTDPDRRRTREIIEQNEHQAELEAMVNRLRQPEVLQLVAGVGDWFAEAEQEDRS